MIRVPAVKEDISKKWFQQILDNVEEDVTVDEIDVKDGTKAGENYSSLILRVQVKGKKKGQLWNQSFIVKVMPLADHTRKMLAENRIFHKEVEAYNEVIPYMMSIQQSEEKLVPDVPRCYFAKTDENNNGAIVLEDLKPLGYQLPDLKKGQDINHCRLFLKNLAKFHALGYKCKFVSKEAIGKKFEGIGRYLYEECKAIMQPMVQSSLKHLDNLLVDCPKKEEWKNRMEIGFPKVLDKATSRDCPKDDLFYTICHGDVSNNNMLYSYGDDGKPTSLKLLDLQILYYGNPARDLAYFFCMTTTGDLRKNHLRDLLEYYRQELFSFLGILQVTEISEKDLTFDKLLKMYYEKVHIGFFYAFGGIPILLMPQEIQVKPEEVKGKSRDEVRQLMFQRASQNILQDKNIRIRVCDLIEEMIENKVV